MAVVAEPPMQEPSTMQVSTIGIDLAKSVFQVHGVDATGGVSVKKKLRRAEVLTFFKSLPPCLVGMEACATAHFWAREIGALGHEVRLMPPSYVKAYVRRQKNDAADAAAIRPWRGAGRTRRRGSWSGRPARAWPRHSLPPRRGRGSPSPRKC